MALGACDDDKKEHPVANLVRDPLVNKALINNLDFITFSRLSLICSCFVRDVACLTFFSHSQKMVTNFSNSACRRIKPAPCQRWINPAVSFCLRYKIRGNCIFNFCMSLRYVTHTPTRDALTDILLRCHPWCFAPHSRQPCLPVFRLPFGRLWPRLHQKQVRLHGFRQLAAGGPAQPEKVTGWQRGTSDTSLWSRSSADETTWSFTLYVIEYIRISL